MTPVDFANWLKGYLADCDKGLSDRQTAEIQDRLKSVQAQLSAQSEQLDWFRQEVGREQNDLGWLVALSEDLERDLNTPPN